MNESLLDVLASSLPRTSAKTYGVVVGIVTNNQDPEGLGRVKVRFPWLSDANESHWARLAAPMAGKERGAYFLPEVDDEVLVAFEHGDARYPYVLGALWNGQDKPPGSNSDGKNNWRFLKSRSGHIIRLDDSDGEEKIEIVDKSEKNSIVIRTKDNVIEITADQDIEIKAHSGQLRLSGNGIEINSQAGIKLEAQQTLDLKANSQLNIKGGVVNIN
jgi:uncharacterized protein involved in type VI secretion and phage assembly